MSGLKIRWYNRFFLSNFTIPHLLHFKSFFFRHRQDTLPGNGLRLYTINFLFYFWCGLLFHFNIGFAKNWLSHPLAYKSSVFVIFKNTIVGEIKITKPIYCASSSTIYLYPKLTHFTVVRGIYISKYVISSGHKSL